MLYNRRLWQRWFTDGHVFDLTTQLVSVLLKLGIKILTYLRSCDDTDGE